MITPAYAPTATERVLPRLSLDFTTGVLDSRVTVTRALNTATRVNSSGLIETVNANLPRFDYNPATLQPRGLLIEEQRTNLLKQSSGFTDPVWNNMNYTVSVNSLTAPDGTLTADKLVLNNGFAANAGSAIFQFTTLGAILSTCSLYVKNGGFNQKFIIQDSIGNGAEFNAATMTLVGAVGSGSGTITDAGNGWYRCVVFFPSTPNPLLYFYFSSGTGNGTDGIYAWGAQLEAGAFATSYIPTTTTSVTRNADVVSMTGTNFSSWYGASANSIAVSVTPISVSGVRPACQADDGTTNEVVSLRGNATDPELYIVDGGVAQAQIDAGSIVANTTYTLCGAWALNNCAVSKSGGAPGTDASATMPSPNQLRIGSDGTNYLCGWARTLRAWPQRITNAETQAFSK